MKGEGKMKLTNWLDKRTETEKVIDKKLEFMAEDAVTPEEISNVIELYERRHKFNPKLRVSPDVVLTVGCNLLGILAIIYHEQVGVITSKALGLVMRSRV